MTALLVLVLLTLAALAAVVQPLFQSSHPALARVDESRLALLEERDRALRALRELEFDHRAGVISDVDYRELVGPLRRQAATALGALQSDA
jgi:hypothetical protein